MRTNEMNLDEARQIARKYHTPLTQCPKAMQKALGVEPTKRNRKRGKPPTGRKFYTPKRRDVERCMRQKHGVTVEE